MANFSNTLIIVLYIIIQSEAFDDDWERYCNISTTHILCSYANGTEIECDGKRLRTTAVTEVEKTQILDKFNNFRMKISHAKLDFIHGNRGPRAIAMQELKWDTFLEEMAKARCLRCNYTYIDKRENVELRSFTPFEMIASPSHPIMADKFVEIEWNDSILDAVDKIWIAQKDCIYYNDAEYFGRKDFDEYMALSSRKFPVNELTYSTIQVIIDDLYMIGCAKSTYIEQENPIYFYSCFTGASYVPTYTLIVRDGYITGSNCTDLSANYKGLCSSEDELLFPSASELEQLFSSTEEPYTGNLGINETGEGTLEDIGDNDGSIDLLTDGDENDDEGSRSSKNCCFWSLFFFCSAVAIFK